MFVRVKSTPNSPRKSVQICESKRRGDKVTQRIVRYVGVAMNEEELEQLKALAEGIKDSLERGAQMPLFKPEDLQRRKRTKDVELKVDLKELREEQRVIEGVHEVFGQLYEELGFGGIFGRGKAGIAKSKVLKDIVLARLAQPSSKLRTAALLERDFGIRVPVDRIYRMMDHLCTKVDKVQGLVADNSLKLFKRKVDVCLYDVTTLHFESDKSVGIKEFGYSKDGKFNEVQVVLGMLTTPEGLPLGYELFSGDTFEGDTLLKVLDKFARRFEIRRIICVADRGMFSKKNLDAIKARGWEFVVGARIRSLGKKKKEEILKLAENMFGKHPNEDWSSEIEADNGCRLVISYSCKIAEYNKEQRKRGIARLQKKLTKKGSVKASKLLSNKAAKKYLTDTTLCSLELDRNKIANDARWDGLLGIMTNSNLKKEEVVTVYKNLWNIEAAFRLNKHDLKIRPIFHWTDKRIKAHIAICFIAFDIAQHVQYRISIQQSKMSFEAIRDALLSVQASVLRHTKTKKLYRVPSKLSTDARKIYTAFGIKRSVVPEQYT